MRDLSLRQLFIITVFIVMSVLLFQGCLSFHNASQTPIPVVYDIEGNQPQ